MIHTYAVYARKLHIMKMYTYNIHTYYADKIKMCLCHILVGKKLSKFNVRKDESLPHKPLATPHSSQSSPAPAGRRRGGYGFAVGTRTQSTRRTGGSSCGDEGGGDQDSAVLAGRDHEGVCGNTVHPRPTNTRENGGFEFPKL